MRPPRSRLIRKRAGALLLVLALAGCARLDRPASPGAETVTEGSIDVAAIDVDRDCNANDALDRVLRFLSAGHPSAESMALSGNAIEHRLHIWEGLMWRGLTLHSVGSVQGINAGPSVFSLFFREQPKAVLARLNAEGYDLPAPGEDRGVDGALSIGVHATEDGSALTCWFD